MMQRAKILYILTAGLFSLLSCEHDNYDPPSAGIRGSVTDAITGGPFQTEQPNGLRIRMIEEGYENPVPIDFWANADGAFEHSKLFPGQYQVVPVEGAFFPVDTQEVTLDGMTEVDFIVTPFLAVSASITQSGGSVTVDYQIQREREEDKIIACATLASEYPSVNNTVFDQRVSHDLSAVDDQEILDTQFSDELTGLQSGLTYYIRVAALTGNFLGRYNYSEVFEVTIP